jgi:lysozyme
MDGANIIVDLSHHNASPDFSEASKHIRAVILKATQGTSYVDPTFQARRQEALDNGLLVGAYHFATKKPAKAQVDHFLQTVGAQEGQILAIDIEADPGSVSSVTYQQALGIIDLVKERTGSWPLVYGGSYLRELLQGQSASSFKNCPLWWAAYNNHPNWPSDIWPEMTIWQYTDGTAGNTPHEVQGIGKCDRDIFNGSASELEKFWAAGAHSFNKFEAMSLDDERTIGVTLEDRLGALLQTAVQTLTNSALVGEGRTVPLFFPDGIQLIDISVEGNLAGAAQPILKATLKISGLKGSDKPPLAGLAPLQFDMLDNRLSTTSDQAQIATLIQHASSIEGLAAARKEAKEAWPEFPDNGCAAHLSALLRQSKIDVPMTLGAGKLASIIKSRGWKRIEVGHQQLGDVGVTFALTPPPGADHIYLVIQRVDADQMVITDNQSNIPHTRYTSGKGKTPTEYFLRA